MHTKIIANVSRDYDELKKLYNDKQNERDILGTQLIRRNDELALLYEKLKIQQSTLNKGEAQYSHRTEEIRQFKNIIRNQTSSFRRRAFMIATDRPPGHKFTDTRTHDKNTTRTTYITRKTFTVRL